MPSSEQQIQLKWYQGECLGVEILSTQSENTSYKVGDKLLEKVALIASISRSQTGFWGREGGGVGCFSFPPPPPPPQNPKKMVFQGASRLEKPSFWRIEKHFRSTEYG
jgi:hypothetical protein